MAVRVEIVTDLARLAALGPEWARLHAAAGGGPFSSFDWLSAWVAAYADADSGGRPCIMLAWAGDALAAAMPLAGRRAPLACRVTSWSVVRAALRWPWVTSRWACC